MAWAGIVKQFWIYVEDRLPIQFFFLTGKYSVVICWVNKVVDMEMEKGTPLMVAQTNGI